MARRLRFLLIEDNSRRVEMFRSWMPGNVILVETRSAGQAMGFLKRLQPGELAGMLLDHDLHQQALTTQDLQLSGSTLVNLILRFVDNEVAILVHSMNPAGAAIMASQLEGNGYWVTRIPMAQLTRATLQSWIEEVRELHED